MKKLLLLALAMLLMRPLVAQTVSTLATNLGVGGDGIFAAPSGDLFVSGGATPTGPASVVLRVTADGEVSTFADVFNAVGIYMDRAGDLFVNNYRANTVSRISPAGEVTTIATNLNGPAGIVVNSRDEILVAEFGANGSGRGAAVKKVSRDGTVEPFISGNGLLDPLGIAVDEDDNVYVANWNTGEIFQSDGETTTLFAEIGGRVNQIAYAGGYLYVPSPSLRKVFRVDGDGNVEHIAGTGASGSADGPALEATFGRPNSITVGTDGRTLYVIDADAQSVRVIHPASGTDVESDPHPRGFDLHQNYPNPVRGLSRIGFTLQESGRVRLAISDVLGREVLVLIDGVCAAGTHEAVLDAAGLAAGAYVYRLEAGEGSQSRVMTVVR